MTTPTDLLTLHRRYIKNAKAGGFHIKAFTTPCCQEELEAVVPEVPEVVWDTLTMCPYCGALFLKLATNEKVEALIP